ncbi:MAG TPA: pyridoxal phosphate-dependent aminotransferase [Vicinamibacterales bacterium]|nr:pyridoxal phosphate-dependent aminotransferase [Vicinamibacterales bacterium]
MSNAVLAQRLSNVTGSATMKVAAEADRLKRAGHQIVDFGAGEPDFPTPQHVKDAAKAAIDANFSRYTNAMGIPEFREAVAAQYTRHYGIDVTMAEVVLTNGGKQALFNTALALFNPGDEVITHAPYWPTIPEQIKIAQATPVIVQTKPDDGFTVHPEKIVAAITPKTKAIIVNSPCNPTGSLTDVAAMTPIVDAAAARGIWVIVDLCYEHLIYDEVNHNLPKLLFDRHRDRSVICGSLSKTYAMTGWRAGWTIAPKELTAAFNVIMGHTTSNIASIVQKAGVVALNGPQDGVKVMLDEYRRRRDAIHGWLTANPAIKCVKPRGAFYLFPDVSELLGGEVKSSSDFAQKLIEQEHVALTPGEGFDAPGYLRISYATSMDQLREGATRILRLAESLQPKASAIR